MPEREDLEAIYREVISPSVEPLTLMTLSSGTLIKAICRGEYYRRLDIVPKWKVVYFLAQCFGMSESAVSSYLPSRAQKYVNVRQIGERGAIATFANIQEAAQVTGISKPAIIASITRGCKASNWRFEADIFKPILAQ